MKYEVWLKEPFPKLYHAKLYKVATATRDGYETEKLLESMGFRATEKRHISFGLSDGENEISVYGDPDMSDETKSALLEMEKALRRAVENGNILKGL